MARTPRVSVVTDSTADIPAAIANEMRISVVPAILTIDNETFRDSESFSRDDFYRRMPSMKSPATTAVPSIDEFKNAYETGLEMGADNVFAIHVSSKLSAMYDTATRAAEDFGDRVETFDSEQLSLGLGFQAMDAADCALRGNTLDEVRACALRARQNARVFAMINSLEYLRRSGRVSWLQAGVGDMLRIKVLIDIQGGLPIFAGRTRTRKKGVEKLIECGETWKRVARFAVLHSGVPDEATEIAHQLDHISSTPVLVVSATTIIGAHIGPRSLGLAALVA